MKETVIETSNLRLSALSWGASEKPPVIALHGWLDNAASFVPLAELLDNFHLIAIDFPGHGKSEHRRGVNAYHFVDYATDVLLAANALGFSEFSLLGHSLGAGVAALICAAAPKRVQSLAMIEGLAPVSGRPEAMLDQLQKHIDAISRPRSAARIFETIEQAAQARKAAGDLSLKAAQLIAERNLIATEGGYKWRTDRCLNKPSPVYLTELHVETYLSQLQCDTLLIRSNQGILKNWNSLQGRESLIKSATIVDIDGGHHCHMDNPQSIAPHLLRFFGSTDSGDGVLTDADSA